MREPLIFQENLLPNQVPRSKIQIFSGWAALPETSSFHFVNHVESCQHNVDLGRSVLVQQFPVLSKSIWLTQQHTTEVVQLSSVALPFGRDTIIADASVSCEAGLPCVVLTADCVPILLVDPYRPQVAAIHAGWRGLANGIVQNTLKTFPHIDHIYAFIAPCISQPCFEVGQDVHECFLQLDVFKSNHLNVNRYFSKQEAAEDKWFADLCGLTTAVLEVSGVQASRIAVSGLCTYQDKRLPSYRLNKTGRRMVSFIWFSD